MGSDNILAREREHHDNWASEIDVQTVKVVEAFEGSTAPENRFIMQRVGDLTGRRVLDVGCGAGESSVYFALQGAECHAVDSSEGMMEVVERLAARFGVSVKSHVMDAGHLEFDDDSFDVVYAANLLHHVDSAATLRQMYRVARKGGRVCFWDPLAHNPLINIYRRMATGVRSEDESPLSMGFLKTVRELFPEVSYDTFWISTLWIFLRFYLIEGVDPNKERYWKKIIDEEERLRPTYVRLEKLDAYLKKLPFIKRYAWNLAVVATK
jgi:ubiquinone/menaquinone biosynthesis C-methylase UbiE